MARKNRNNGDKNNPEITPEARRKQVILGIVMGAIVGGVIWAISGFWGWLPAGLAFGLATGSIMKPPTE